jgi:hypothetical protein
MALWHLANNISDPTVATDLLPAAGRPDKVRVVGIDAEGAGYPVFARHGGLEAKSLAAELVWRLAGDSALNALGPVNSAAASPDASLVEAMLPDEPVLILLDELVLYMAKLTDQEVGNLVGFLRSLITAIVGRSRAVLVITDPKDQPTDAKQAQKLASLAQTLEQHTGRTATVIEPIGDETAQVILRRLFESVDGGAAAKASADYHALYQRISDEHPSLMPEEAKIPKYAERIRTCYPLHPRLLKTAEERLRVMPDYNLSRGTLRLFARVIRTIWDDPDRDPEIITAGDLDWSAQEIQADLLERLGRDKFRAAVQADVLGHAVDLDQGKWGSHRRAASALLLESLPLEANSGLGPAELTLATVRPEDAGNEPADALDHLAGACWHLYPMSGSANAWQFRYEPNILKQIEERMVQVPVADALDRLKADVQKSFHGSFGKLVAWPTNAKSVPDRSELQIALCQTEDIAKSVVSYSDDTPNEAKPREFVNAIVAVAPDAGALQKAVERVQRLMAAEAIDDEQANTEQGKLAREQLKKLLPDMRKRARIDQARAFNRIALSDGSVLTIDERFIVPDENQPLNLPAGQDAVRTFLEDRKLVSGPNDALAAEYFYDKVFKGAVPAASLPEARSTEKLQKRFLSAPGLKLVADNSIIRASILKAVEQGVLAVRTAEGQAYDKAGGVYHANGKRQRDPELKLTTLAIDDQTLVAPAGSPAIQEWFVVDEGEKPGPIGGGLPMPPPPPQGGGPVTVYDLPAAADHADRRKLLKLRLKCTSAADAQKVLGIVQPLGAQQVGIEADLAGDMKDGGKLSFAVTDAKVAAAIKPLTLAQTIGNALVPGATVSVSVVLGFGQSGKADLGAVLRGINLPDGASTEASFAGLSEV